MGSFSWMRADRTTKVGNIYYDYGFKFLIPKEFGGGFIKDRYQGYGYLGVKESGEPKYDMYELLALWNLPIERRCKLKFDGEFNPMKEIDDYTVGNRSIGIDLGCHDKQIDKLKYPLKLVSSSYEGTYEECGGRSYGDPHQGFGKLTWEEYDNDKI